MIDLQKLIDMVVDLKAYESGDCVDCEELEDMEREILNYLKGNI